MIRTPLHRLRDIDQNISLILECISHKTLEEFAHNTAQRYAVLHALMIIAEAVRSLPPDLTAGHPSIPWSKIVGIGTKIKHEYHRVDPFVAWTAATVHLLPLRTVILQMIADLAADAPAT